MDNDEPEINLNAILEEAWNEANEIEVDMEQLDDTELVEQRRTIKERAQRIMKLLDPFVGDQGDKS